MALQVCAAMSSITLASGGVRPPALAGTWYPGRKAQLVRKVDGLLEGAGKPKARGRLCALIAPHAGYAYSGRVAGHSFGQIGGRKFGRVIVLAPSHHARFRGFSIMDVDAYETPLGQVPLDRDVCDALARSKLHVRADRYHSSEHSIEIELPFLQRTLGKFQLVPILVGGLGAGDADEIAKAIEPYMSPETLVLVSSDFTHYGRRFAYAPFTTNVEDNLRKLDMGAVDLILRKDAAGYARYLTETRATICGRNPIAILLRLLPDDAKGELLKYDTSGRITGDWTNSVSYVSIAFTAPAGRGNPTMNETQGVLNVEEKKTLLRLARSAIDAYLRTARPPTVDGSRLPPRLKARAGAFVTLKKDGRLRGCIGRIGYPEIADRLPPLYETISLMAIQSATGDYRFPPVRKREMKGIHIEISVLSIAKEVGGPADFEVGELGIIIRKGRRSAVFLPQVAPEQGWTRDQTLRQLCRKAGLPEDEWTKPGMEFFVFTAQVFDESLLEE